MRLKDCLVLQDSISKEPITEKLLKVARGVEDITFQFILVPKTDPECT